MARTRWQAMVIAACVLLATACGGAQGTGSSTPDVASDDATVAAAPSTAATGGAPSSPSAAAAPGVGELADATDDDRPVERSLRPVIDEAVRDLVDRTGVPPDQVRVVLAQRVTWSDDTLGCPLRGDGLGGPHPGTRVHLEVDGVLYRYHSGRGEEPFLCDPAAAKSEEQHERNEP